MEFEFGETAATRSFFDRHQKFFPAFEQLISLANRCLGRRMQPKNRLEDVSFGLGHACLEDYLEIVLLACNGYGTGASKLFRGLYERTVTLAYLIKHPEKAERFTRFAAVQEHRAMEGALKTVSLEQFDAAMKADNSVASIRE